MATAHDLPDEQRRRVTDAVRSLGESEASIDLSFQRADELIAGDFPEIYFEKSRKDKEKDTDIVKFEIACVSREED